MSDWRGRKVGNYQLVERLGQGGMGVVYRARDTMLDRDVALKMMSPIAGEETSRAEISARFFVEAKAAARIQSRHVAQVLQLGETEEGEVYIVMELLVGEALSRVLQNEGRLAPERAVRIARQIARGMQAAHALGVVHRDLKPANVMLVSLDGEDEVVKILDFGVAKLTRAEDQNNLTQTGALLGTLPYMAPEQILSKPVDARTDVYALGVVLYRMLAGAPLFDAESLSDVVRHQVQTPAPAFAARVPGLDVPPAIESVVLRCLEKDPRRRYASMADLDVALGRALEGRAEASGAQPVTGKKLEETLPTGSRLPVAALTALAPLGEETRSVLVPTAEEARASDVAPPDESAVFQAPPRTEPEPAAPPARPFLPLAAALAVVVALVAVAAAVVLVLLVSPEGEAPAPSAQAPAASAPLAPSAPAEAKPAETTPDETKPTDAKPDDAKPTDAKPDDAKPDDAKTDDAKTADATPTDAKPDETKPDDAKPDDAKPDEATAGASTPAATKPATTKPTATKPTATKPTATKPAATKPAPTKPAAKPSEPEAPGGFRRVLTKEGG